MAMINLINYNNLNKHGTYLTVFIELIIAKRSMQKMLTKASVICMGLCGNFKGSKAVGHLTHGYPTILPSQGQVVNLDANTDAKGSPDPQNAVMYVKGHTVGQTVENVQGSAFLNQAHVLDQIEKYADKS